MYWLITRIMHEFSKEIELEKVEVVIATSPDPANAAFEMVANETDCKIFIGSEENIPLRQLQCAQALSFTEILSIDGDDILCSNTAMREIYSRLLNTPPSNHFTTTGLPLGMNASGYRISYLEERLHISTDIKLETGWGRIFDAKDITELKLGDYDLKGDLRFTLDYEEDALFFRKTIEHFEKGIISAIDTDIIAQVEKEGFYKLNCGLKEKYWNNFLTEKQKETDEK